MTQEDKKRFEQYCINVANTAYKQLLWSVDIWKLFSWGITQKIATSYRMRPMLKMHVNGLIHQGWVCVTLNHMDTYDVTLIDDNDNIVNAVDDVYADSLGRVIDSLVEKPLDMTDEEYKSKISQL